MAVPYFTLDISFDLSSIDSSRVPSKWLAIDVRDLYCELTCTRAATDFEHISPEASHCRCSEGWRSSRSCGTPASPASWTPRSNISRDFRESGRTRWEPYGKQADASCMHLEITEIGGEPAKPSAWCFEHALRSNRDSFDSFAQYYSESVRYFYALNRYVIKTLPQIQVLSSPPGQDEDDARVSGWLEN